MRRLNAVVAGIDGRVLGPAVLTVGLVALLATVEPMLYYEHIVTRPGLLAVWPLTLGVTPGILLVAFLYIAGHRHAVIDRYAGLRQLSFFGGLAAIFLALQSPLEPISDHLFIAHQVEHMLLRTVAPMLLILAAPQAALLRGLPSWIRRHVVTPLLGSRAIRALGILAHPVAATILFVGTTYFWMIPRYHDLAILDEPVHYLWHATLLASGLVFFWRILDPRPYPLGASLGVRLFMFWLASTGNILLGSYLSFKHQVLYHAYDEMGRLWGIAPAVDENYGGLTMWIPGSMMFAITAMLMVYRWAKQEERDAMRRRNGVPILKAAELLRHRQSANRRMAIGLICFVVTVAAITFTTTLIYHYSGHHLMAVASSPGRSSGPLR